MLEMVVTVKVMVAMVMIVDGKDDCDVCGGDGGKRR